MRDQFLRHSREPIFSNISPIILTFIALCGLFYILPAYFFSSQQYEQFYRDYAFIPALFSHNHSHFQAALTSLSYSFLHADSMHLIFNMAWLLIFGTPLANRIGTIGFIIFWIFMSVFSILGYYFCVGDDFTLVIGASGVISAMMGAGARYAFQRAQLSNGRIAFGGTILPVRIVWCIPAVRMILCFWIVSDLLYAFSSSFMGAGGYNIAWQVHIFGLLAGFFFIPFFDSKRSF